MSRDLGPLQRAILEVMNAHRALLEVKLKAIQDDQAARPHVHVEDLRAVVARRLGIPWPEGHTRSFQAAFSRACRTLGARDLIFYDPYFCPRLIFTADEPDKR